MVSDVFKLFFLLPLYPWEHLAESHKWCCNLTTCHNNTYRSDNHYETENDARSELLAEDGYAKENGSDWFEGTQNSSRCAAYVLDGTSGATEGNGSGKDCKGYQT